jgi:GntR family transcriptional regulator
MFFKLNPNGAEPMYEQIVRQVKLAVTNGILVAGEMVPSVRQLSKELAINPNTIGRAYQDLQNDGVLEPLRGRGMVVRREAGKICAKARDSMVAAGVRRALGDALAGGMTVGELRKIFEGELAKQPALRKATVKNRTKTKS